MFSFLVPKFLQDAKIPIFNDRRMALEPPPPLFLL